MTDYRAAYRAQVAAEVAHEAAATALLEALPVAYDAGFADGFQAAIDGLRVEGALAEALVEVTRPRTPLLGRMATTCHRAADWLETQAARLGAGR